MKLFEFFYLGKPVIATQIVELQRYKKYVRIGKTADEWEKYISDSLSRPWPLRYRKEQKQLAIENSWERKIQEIYTIFIEI